MVFVIFSKVEYKSVCTLKGHEGSVTCVAGLYLTSKGSDGETLIISASIDSTVRLWHRTGSGRFDFSTFH